jgi:hypothetical protein
VNNHINSIFIKTRTTSKSQLIVSLLAFVSDEFERLKVRVETLEQQALE